MPVVLLVGLADGVGDCLVLCIGLFPVVNLFINFCAIVVTGFLLATFKFFATTCGGLVEIGFVLGAGVSIEFA